MQMPPKPSGADLRVQRADQLFINGKKLYQAGELEAARKEFDHAVDVLLTAPESRIHTPVPAGPVESRVWPRNHLQRVDDFEDSCSWPLLRCHSQASGCLNLGSLAIPAAVCQALRALTFFSSATATRT